MIANSDLPKIICKEVKKRMRNIRTDVGKKKFIVCVMDDKEKILEGTAYDSTLADAKEFAG